MTAAARVRSLPTPAGANLVVDVDQAEARVAGRPVDLSPTQFRLLAALARDPTRLCSKADLYAAVWDGSLASYGTTRTLDNHACRLRLKLAAAGFGGAVVNSWGQGYRLVTPGREACVRVRGGPSVDAELAASAGIAIDVMEHLGEALIALGGDARRVARQQREQAEARRVARRGTE